MLDWGVFSFLAEPWFVIPWYAFGLVGMAAVIRDVRAVNTPLKQAMKWAWPIIVLFFSVLGLALYFGTARAPGIGEMDEQQKKQAHERYERSMLRRVNGAVIHCVAGDGLGIMSAMVVARAARMSFWHEFWFEYATGFAFGWFIFQLKSMRMMTGSLGKALWMAFRAEFFSMLTVMGGMGAVMAYVTPLAVTAQPRPLTYAFWGFGMLGLFAGYLFTFPMNWMLVKIGWKHGMGGKEGASPAPPAFRPALLGAMVALGAIALAIPAWLDHLREARPSAGTIAQNLAEGQRCLREGRRSDATQAIDAAHRAAKSAGMETAMRQIDQVRHALWIGDPEGAEHALRVARSGTR